MTDFSQISVADLIGAMPKLLAYLRTIDIDALGLSGLPFVEKSLGSLLDVASVFEDQVVNKIDFNRPMQLWLAGKGETAAATGTIAARETGASVQAGSAQLRGAAGQFAASMAGYWVSVTGTPGTAGANPVTAVAQIVSVSADGSTLNLTRNFAQDLNAVSYKVHRAIETIQTIEIGRAHV